MFTILGADGKEYGPVPTHRVHEWINGGRANLQTKARRADETEWKTLADFPEFATAVPPPAPAPSPAVPDATGAVDVDALANATGTLDIGGCIRAGFATGAANFFPLLGVCFVIALISGLVNSIPILGLVATFTLTGVFYGGLYYYAAKVVRGEPAEFGDAFSGFTHSFAQLVLATLAVTLLTIVGFVCLILPGLYVAVCWMFTYALVRDKGLHAWDAMELGRKAITRQWFRVFGFCLVICLFACVLLAVPLGLIFMSAAAARGGGTPNLVLMGLGIMSAAVAVMLLMPFATAMMMHAYENIFGERRGPGASSPMGPVG
jgi:hypothetical protein